MSKSYRDPVKSEARTKLRKFISEMITPFNDKVGQLGKEVKKLDASSETNLS